ncbi:MAG: alcohol dehydrogenase catalytic domain-containing protein [Gammaproteobacteria bacterium]|nr:alcohol dehydrogenase catalytic domain-containing protein [Gammaproteobacteria bacterium]
MKAVITQGLHQPLRVASLPDPVPGPGEVVLQVARCGICGSDLHATEDAAYGVKPGAVLGHEFAGEVIALGPGVTSLATGDRVSAIPLMSCGHCPACLAGEPAWCAEFALQGGGYAEYVRTRASQCLRLPRSASVADGAIIEPLAVALHGVLLSELKPRDKVLVLGAGPIGLGVAFWARRLGAAQVVVQDIVPHQKERALALGATDFIVDRDDPIGASDRALGSKADIVYECVGVPGLIAQAARQVRVKGTVLILGLCTRPDSFVPFEVLSKELRLQTSAYFRRQEYETALDALDAGAAQPRLLVTDTIGLEQVPQSFEALKSRTHHCKVLIAP